MGRERGMEEIEGVGSGEVAHCVTYRLHKQEDLNLGLSNYIKVGCDSVCLQPQRDRQIPGLPDQPF